MSAPGRLVFRTRPVDGHGVIQHEGIAQLVRVADGMLIFDLDIDGTEDIALHPDELVSFVRLEPTKTETNVPAEYRVEHQVGTRR